MSMMWILKFQEKQSYLELWSLISLYGTGTQNVTFIRSAHEQSKKNRSDWERVQKTAVRVIMGNNYKTYKESLKMFKLGYPERCHNHWFKISMFLIVLYFCWWGDRGPTSTWAKLKSDCDKWWISLFGPPLTLK